MAGSNVDRPRQPRGEIVANRGTESLVNMDDEFVARLQERQVGIIRRLMPNQADKKVAEYEARMVGLASEAKVENYRMFLELQRQAIKEALDDFLLQGKVKSRKGQTEFFEYHSRDLQKRVNDSTQEYFEDMTVRLAALAAANHPPTIRQRQERMLEQRMDEFENTITLLMSRFASIPEEGV